MKMSRRPLQLYQLLDKKNEYLYDSASAPSRIDRLLHSHVVQSSKPADYFNRAVKRGETILLTGNRPRYALMRHFQERKQDPDHCKLGDGRIRLYMDGQDAFLHEADHVRAIFADYGTTYECSFSQFPFLVIKVVIALMEDRGAVIRIELRNDSEIERTLRVATDYGGMCRHGRTFTGAYLFLENDSYEDNYVFIKEDVAVVGNTEFSEEVGLWGFPVGTSALQGKRVMLIQEIALPPGETRSCSQFLDRSWKRKDCQCDSGSIILDSKQYMEAIAGMYVVDTPDAILDSAFTASVMNLEEIWTGASWLEGLHWWAAPWAQDFQLSAGISLGQYQRVQQTLDTLRKIKPCPAPGLTASMEPLLQHADMYTHGTEDGLPYYLYQLCQYYEATGDLDLLEKSWEPVQKGICAFFEKRENKDGTVNFHLGCNMFLYQADTLELPGNAASPTMFMAGMLERLARIASRIGKEEDARKWKEKSDKLYNNLEKLWDEHGGYYYSHIDNQGVAHGAHYYTDMVFPILYTTLPDDRKVKPLLCARESLMTKTEDGRLLMKVGDLIPDIFGSMHIGAVQMCETARAFCRTGCYGTAWKLLHTVAYGSTVYTESPGALPERLNRDGKGEANYIFGNSAGAFCDAVIRGLFGISIRDAGNVCHLTPSFPQDWGHASMVLPYGSMEFERKAENGTVEDVYRVSLKKPMKMEFSVFPKARKVQGVIIDGQPGTVTEKMGRIYCKGLLTERKDRFTISVRYSPANLVEDGVSRETEAVRPCISEVFLKESRGLKPHPIPLPSYDYSGITVMSAWRLKRYDPDFTPYLSKDGILWIHGLPFAVSFKNVDGVERIGMLKACYGISNPYTTALHEMGFDEVRIPVNQKGRVLAILYLTECQSRNTGCISGTLRVQYADHSMEEHPMVIGRTVDTVYSHTAIDTLPVYIPSDFEHHPIHPGKDYANLFLLPVHGDVPVQEIQIKIQLADVEIGIVGVSMLV